MKKIFSTLFLFVLLFFVFTGSSFAKSADDEKLRAISNDFKTLSQGTAVEQKVAQEKFMQKWNVSKPNMDKIIKLSQSSSVGSNNMDWWKTLCMLAIDTWSERRLLDDITVTPSHPGKPCKNYDKITSDWTYCVKYSENCNYSKWDSSCLSESKFCK